MHTEIDIDAILAPIPGDNPVGEDLHYSPVYDEIKEARRADEDLPQGDWGRELKRADWDKVISVAVAALTDKSKDLQIAVWLTEALTTREGFAGLAVGLRILNGLLSGFWEQVYPAMEDGDLEYRAAPIEFLDDRLWLAIKQVPITEPRITGGYSWLKWKEARDVGYEAELRGADGTIEEKKRKAREERIADGKLRPEDFDIGVALSSEAFYRALAEDLSDCKEQLGVLSNELDDKFGRQAPSITNFRSAIEDCQQTLKRIIDKKMPKESKAEPEPGAEPGKPEGFVSRLFRRHRTGSGEAGADPEKRALAPTAKDPGELWGEAMAADVIPLTEGAASAGGLGFDSESLEIARWNSALETMETDGMEKALGRLLAAVHSAPSVRARNRYRLLMARLCLEAGRVDLARPIVEQLHALIEELQLERWESPRWIAEVLDALYQCLTWGEPSDEDMSKAGALFRKLCTTDVTKAMMYKD